MLDTYGRKYVSPLINGWVLLFEKLKMTPTQVTVLAFIIGIISMVFYGTGYIVSGVLLLWFSGLLDAVDGALARKTGQISKWGTLLDITFDRLVEIGMLITIVLVNPTANFSVMIVLGSIIFSMTVFLTVAALSQNDGKKSFKYQPGLAERTEGFLFITLMMIYSSHVILLGYLFSGMIIITAIQRLHDAKKVLND